MRPYKEHRSVQKSTGHELSNSGSKQALAGQLTSHPLPALSKAGEPNIVKGHQKLEPLPIRRQSFEGLQQNITQDKRQDNPLYELEQKLDRLASILERGFAAQNEGFKMLAECLEGGFVSQSEGLQLINQGTLMLGKTIKHGFASLTKSQNRVANRSEAAETKEPDQPKRDQEHKTTDDTINSALVRQQVNSIKDDQVQGSKKAPKLGDSTEDSNQGKVTEQKQTNTVNNPARVQQKVKAESFQWQLASDRQFGEFRDRQVVLSYGQPIENCTLPQSFDQDRLTTYTAKWVGQAVSNIIKEAFEGYCSRKMSETDTRVFVCSNILLNYHEMMRQAALKFEDSVFVKSLLRLTFPKQLQCSLEYYLMKYPQKSKIFLSNDMNFIAKEMNRANLPEHSILRKLGVRFETKENQSGQAKQHIDFSRDIKLLINKLVEESKRNLPRFKQLMTDVFTTNCSEQNSVTMIEHLIGMKFKESIPTYDDSDLGRPGVPIKSPQVLRVIIKWIEELDEISSKPHILAKRRVLTKGQSENPSVQDKLVGKYFEVMIESIQCNTDDEFMWNNTDGSILFSACNSLQDYAVAHKQQFECLPRSAVEIGTSVHVLSTLTEETAIIYLHKIINFLIRVESRVFKGFVASNENKGIKYNEIMGNVISFSVFDLLRAKCLGTLEEVKKVIRSITNHKSINVVRIKNRLDTGNRDFLINFTFEQCPLVCEVQVGLKGASGDQYSEHKSVCQDHFNHFLYQLKRSKFGSLSEAALIIGYQSEVGAYFKSHIKDSLARMIKFEVQEVEGEITVKKYKPLNSEATLLCCNCLQLRSSKLFVPWTLSNNSYLCGKCVFNSLKRPQKVLYLLGKHSNKFFEQTNYYATAVNQQGPPFLVMLDSPNDLQPRLYSCFRNDDHNALKYFTGQTGLKLVLQFIGFRESYHECGMEPSSLLGREQTKEKEYIFKLKENLQFIVLNIPDSELIECAGKSYSQTQIEQLMAPTPNNDHLREKYRGQQMGPFKFYWLFKEKGNRNDMPNLPVRCAFDPKDFSLLVLDYVWPERIIAQAEIKHVIDNLTRNQNELSKYLWQYTNRNLSQKNFEGFPQDSRVVTIIVDDNEFTQVDFLKAYYLGLLSMQRNQIKNLEVEKNRYPSLKELNVAGNQIEILDITLLKLSQLERLVVSENPISKIVQDTVASTLPKLKTIEINRTLINEFVPNCISFPSLQEIVCCGNFRLQRLQLVGLATLQKLTASTNPSLTELTLQGDYPQLISINSTFTRLQSVNLRDTKAPALRELHFSMNTLHSFQLSKNEMPLLSQIDLSCNFLVDLELPQVSYLPSLSTVLLSNNFIQKLDWKPSDYPKLDNFTCNGNDRLEIQMQLSNLGKQRDNWLLFRHWRMFVADPLVTQRLLELIAKDSSEVESEYKKVFDPASYINADQSSFGYEESTLNKLESMIRDKYSKEIGSQSNWARLMAINQTV